VVEKSEADNSLEISIHLIVVKRLDVVSSHVIDVLFENNILSEEDMEKLRMKYSRLSTEVGTYFYCYINAAITRHSYFSARLSAEKVPTTGWRRWLIRNATNCERRVGELYFNSSTKSCHFCRPYCMATLLQNCSYMTW